MVAIAHPEYIAHIMRAVCSRCRGRPPREAIVFSTATNSFVHVGVAHRSTPEGIAIVCGGRVVLEGVDLPLLLPGRIVKARPMRARTTHRVRLGEPVRLSAGSWEGTALCDYVPPRERPYWLPISNQDLDDQSTQTCQTCETRFAQLPERSRS